MALGLAGSIVVGELIAAIGLHGRHVHGLPVRWPVLIQAVEFGCVNAMLAIGLVLVYRASRIINFAQAGFGTLGSAVFFELMAFEHWPFLLALLVALIIGTVMGPIVEIVFIRRFTRSSRLVLTVVTLALAQLLGAIAGLVPGILQDVRLRTGVPKTPLSHFRWNVFPIVLTGNDVLLIVVTLLVLLGFVAFFRWTSMGIAIRGAAENDDRASLLGINTGNLASLVWLIAAALSTIAAVLQVPISGGSTAIAASGAIGASTLLRALAAGVLGGMENLPVTVAASLGIAIFERSVFVGFQQTQLVDAALLVVIVVVLLARRNNLARAGEESGGAWEAAEEIRPVPKELASLPTVRTGIRWVLGIGAFVLLGAPWILSFGQINRSSSFAIYGIIVVSLVVLTGWGGQISLGQFAFVAVGAIAGGSLMSRAHWPFLVALLVASALGSAVAMLIGLPALRIKGLFLAVTTVAFAVTTFSVFLNPRYFGSLLPSATIKRPRILWIRFEDERAFYYLCLVCLALAVFAAVGIRKSRTGRVLIAMRDNERTAQSYGINLVATRLATFAISGFLAAFAGVLFALQQRSVNQLSFLPDESINIFLMAVIGGLGSVSGALTGALYLGVLNLLTSSLILRLLGGSIGVLIILMFFPGGLGAAVYKLRDAFLRRVAIRRRIWVPSLLGNLGADGLGKVTLAPKLDSKGSAEKVPVRYRLPSRIRVAGSSQQGKRWSY